MLNGCPMRRERDCSGETPIRLPSFHSLPKSPSGVLREMCEVQVSPSLTLDRTALSSEGFQTGCQHLEQGSSELSDITPALPPEDRKMEEEGERLTN